MDITKVLLLLFLASCCTGLEVNIFGERTRRVSASGQRLSFVCQVDRGADLILTHTVTWVHVSTADYHSPVETVLTNNGDLQTGVDPDFYRIRVAQSLNRLYFMLTVKQVFLSSEGRYICCATPKAGRQPVKDEVSVVIVGVGIGIFGNTRHVVKRGQQLSLICFVNEGLQLILAYELMWVHVSVVDPQRPLETVLTINQELRIGVDPDLYRTYITHRRYALNSTLVLKNVQSTSDGHYVCRVRPYHGIDHQLLSVGALVNVFVGNDVQSMGMIFDNENPVTGEDPTLVQRREGRYNVTCCAAGFNPSVTIRVFVGEAEQTTGSTYVWGDSVASRRAGARRYNGVAASVFVRLLARDSGKKLSCKGKADYAVDAATVVASIRLGIT